MRRVLGDREVTMKKKPKISCKLCGRKVEDDIQSKAEHLYYIHPLEAAKKLLSQAGHLQEVGNFLGEAIKRGIQNDR